METIPNITEAEILAKEFKKMLLENLPSQIFVGEDGTKIVLSVKQDAIANQLIGIFIKLQVAISGRLS